MNILIIEDETAAAVNLRSLLGEVCPECRVLAVLDTVADSVAWLSANPTPDLIFMDIHLADGQAFHIFKHVEITAPIIFTTAYDQYALAAFRVNSIDYLLKPIKADDLRRALDKLRRLTGGELTSYSASVSAFSRRQLPATFLLHVRDKIVVLPVGDIAFCYTQNERVTAYTHAGDAYPIDKSLDSMIQQLPAERFFRANRQFIIAREAIRDIAIWLGNRLSVTLSLPTPEKILISKARAPEFKRWLAGQIEE
ncbi:MAG: response regulator transcription factor [Rikenellaceae bacterium]|nr:response regulator transcription factor [Rikenellaceae bacterium]